MKKFKHQVLSLILLAATGVALAGCSSEASTAVTTSSSSSAVEKSSKSPTSSSTSSSVNNSSSSASSESIQALDTSITDEITQSTSSSTSQKAEPKTTASSTSSATNTASTDSAAATSAPQPETKATPATQKSGAEKTAVIWGNPKSKIYHVPGQHNYRNPHGNGVQFNSEAEAQAAGYRRSMK
ncbi:hypothetical protein ACFQH1_01740 [Lactiplantibacillus daoliensis]|uniref:DNA-entry nuclease n=1 Tax=Lactiplantibacillus daoliensis TaxID=2559916 RepID=A0ABW1UDN0_9LACO|nr:hypothetical protein [Lactiplantibacillus daoliensis]